jgi:hypothetical protein
MGVGILDLDTPLWWTADGLLSAQECAAWIGRIEAAPREMATINAPGGPVLDERMRNNTRVILDDEETARELFVRVRAHVPERMYRVFDKGRESEQRVVGLNERFRCYRYAPGQRFGPHYDGAFVRNDEEQSLLTLLLYLNAPEEGGATAFLDLEEEVMPRPGLALFFQHRLLHEGAELVRGHKYVLRTDVMYRRWSPT